MAENRPDPDSKSFDDRLGSLGEKLRQKSEKGDAEKSKSKDAGNSAGYSNAMKMSSEFIGAILVGAGIGYFIDYFAGTTPWGMVIFMLLGFAAGIRNILRSAGETTDRYNTGLSKTGGPLKKGPDDLYDD